MTKFEIGEWGTWKSQSQGSTKEKTGECVAIIPAGMRLQAAIKALSGSPDESGYGFNAVDLTTLPRDHESYLFALPLKPKGSKRQIYWPRVSSLEKKETPAPIESFKDWRNRTNKQMPELFQRLFATRGEYYEGEGTSWLEQQLGSLLAQLNHSLIGELPPDQQTQLRLLTEVFLRDLTKAEACHLQMEAGYNSGMTP